MNKFKKVSIVALLLLIIGIVGALLTNNEKMRQLPIEEIEITDLNFNQIEILTYDANVELHPTNRSTSYIEVTGTKTSKKLSVSVQDSLLFIKYNNKQVRFFNVNLFNKTEALKVFVPSKHYDQIKVSKHDGRLQIEQLDSDQLTITGKDGLIKLKNITANESFIKANDGLLELEEVAGSIKADMKDSIVKLQATKLQYPVDLAARDGMIQITVTEEPQDTIISTSIQDGLVSIFGERNSSKLFGNGDNKVNLKINDGMITVKH